MEQTKKTPKTVFIQEVIQILLQLVETENKPMKAEYLIEQLNYLHDDYIRTVVFKISSKMIKEVEELNE